MKKLLVALLACLMLTMACFAADITVTLNGEAIDFADQPATIVEGRTLVPLRAIFEALGASVEWDQATKTVTSSMDDVTIKLTIGDNTLYRNDEGVTLDVPAQIINSRTMVPARAIAEAYGVGVEWDAATRTVVLTKEEKPAVEEPEALPEGTFFVLSGENYTGNEGYKFTSGTNILPEIVSTEDDADDKVLFLHSEKTDGQAWTYFRNDNLTFTPGASYIVKFKACAELNALDQEISTASFGVCFRYADSNEDSTVKDHGVATVRSTPGEWVDSIVIYTIPETLIEGEHCGFGIFCNPTDGVAISYYLDDVSVAEYYGTASDGIHTAESIGEAEEAASFDINAAAGVVFDFDEDKDEFSITGSSYEYAGGKVILTADGEDQIDPIMNFKDTTAFTAEKYGAVAVRFKAEGVAENQRHICVYFATASDENLSQSKSVKVDYDNMSVDSEGYYVAYVNMSANEYWKGQLTALRVDPGNSNGIYTVDKIVVVEA